MRTELLPELVIPPVQSDLTKALSCLCRLGCLNIDTASVPQIRCTISHLEIANSSARHRSRGQLKSSAPPHDLPDLSKASDLLELLLAIYL